MMKKIAVVTGSRRGIGLGILKALAREGYHTVMTGVSSAESTESLLRELRDEGLSVEYVKCDISSSSDRTALLSHIEENLGRLDLFVNNAGVAPKSRLDILETTEESFDAVMDTNLKGCFFLSQGAANLMIRCKREIPGCMPRLVNISSISAFTSSVNRGEYCISKAGISMVTTLFADRLAAEGIPVFEVQPGIIMTDMTAGVQEKYQRLIDEGLVPWKRFGYPEDVAGCVLAAASGLLDFSTGQVLHADGGFHLRRL